MLDFMPERFPGNGHLGQMVIFGLSGIKSSITYKLRKICSLFDWKDKIWPEVWPEMSSTILRPCETIWFKLGKYSRSSIKNQLTQSDEALNVDQKWPKNYDGLMHPYRVISVERSVKFINCVNLFLIELLVFSPNSSYIVAHGLSPLRLRFCALYFGSYQELACPTLTFSLRM